LLVSTDEERKLEADAHHRRDQHLARRARL
jgi:hypothetical protein